MCKQYKEFHTCFASESAEPTLAAHCLCNAAQQWFQLREPQRIRAGSTCCKGTLHAKEMERELKSCVEFTQYWWGRNPENTNSVFLLVFLTWDTHVFFTEDEDPGLKYTI